MTAKNVAIYPGTFDPITFGHLDIIRSGLKMFDSLYIAVAANTRKKPVFTADERVELIKDATRGLRGIHVEAFDGLVVDFAKIKKAKVIIRGIRATSDFDYEFQMALMNRKLSLKIQTIFLMPSEENFYLSSGLIKEITHLGGSIGDFVPGYAAGKLLDRLRK